MGACQQTPRPPPETAQVAEFRAKQNGASISSDDKLNKLRVRIASELDAWEVAGAVPKDAHKCILECASLKDAFQHDKDGMPVKLNVAHLLDAIRRVAAMGSGGLVGVVGTNISVMIAILRSGGAGTTFKREWEEFSKCEVQGVVAITEAVGGSSFTQHSTKACLEGDQYVLSGTKSYVTCGLLSMTKYAFLCAHVVAKPTDEVKPNDELAFFLVDLSKATESEAGGKSIERMAAPQVIWQCSGAAQIIFKEHKIPKTACLGGPSLFHQVHSIERFLVAAAAVTVARSAYEETLAFCQTRLVQGGPLIAKQRVSHMLMESLCAIEAAEDHVDGTMSKLSKELLSDGDLSTEQMARISRTKVYSVAVLQKVANDMVVLQGLHGLERGSLARRVQQDAAGFELAAGSTAVLLNVAVSMMGWTKKAAAK